MVYIAIQKNRENNAAKTISSCKIIVMDAFEAFGKTKTSRPIVPEALPLYQRYTIAIPETMIIEQEECENYSEII